MDNEKKNSKNDFKKTSLLSFKELNVYFTNPDSTIKNIPAISAQQFTKDLDFIIDSSRDKLGLHGNIDK